MNTYMKALMRYKNKEENGHPQNGWPVKNTWVDITTGEIITYQNVYMEGKYKSIKFNTKRYDDTINRYTERTIECEPTNGGADD